MRFEVKVSINDTTQVLNIIRESNTAAIGHISTMNADLAGNGLTTEQYNLSFTRIKLEEIVGHPVIYIVHTMMDITDQHRGLRTACEVFVYLVVIGITGYFKPIFYDNIIKRSYIYILNSTGPSTDPCGTP